MESVIEKMAERLQMPDLRRQLEEEVDMTQDEDAAQAAPRDLSVTAANSDQANNWEVVMDADGPAGIPGAVVTESPALAGKTNERLSQDIITRNVISLESAQRYCDLYRQRLDHFLYRILGDRNSLESIRAGSPLLTAAVCTVGALHLASPEFERCYQEFVSLCSAQIFSKRNTIDDVRALCIGAFWLSGMSWALVGAAVRIATEIHLHRSIFKALQGDRTHYMRTRVYYLVYVCDHHFSIAYGRPPLSQQDEAIRGSSQFLETENATEDDARLVSQVYFWSVGSSIFETFGVDSDKPLSASLISQLRRFSISLENIRADWTERFSRNQYVGNYPRKGVGLHYHFAKLYLYSHAFRGIGDPSFRQQDVALEIDELAHSAVLSASAILRSVVSDSEIQSYLDGLPTYFDIMIAFAVVFLLKVSTKYSSYVRVDTVEIRSLVTELVAVLKRVTAPMHARHLLKSIAKGVESLLLKSFTAGIEPINTISPDLRLVPTPQDTTFTFNNSSNDWMADPWNNFSMGEFDFLSSQDFMTNLPYDFGASGFSNPG